MRVEVQQSWTGSVVVAYFELTRVWPQLRSAAQTNRTPVTADGMSQTACLRRLRPQAMAKLLDVLLLCGAAHSVFVCDQALFLNNTCEPRGAYSQLAANDACACQVVCNADTRCDHWVWAETFPANKNCHLKDVPMNKSDFVHKKCTVGPNSLGLGCSTNLGCSLNGICESRVCVCDMPWGGSACDILQIPPSSIAGAGAGIYGVAPNVTSW
jgi:hypothetical protein